MISHTKVLVYKRVSHHFRWYSHSYSIKPAFLIVKISLFWWLARHHFGYAAGFADRLAGIWIELMPRHWRVMTKKSVGDRNHNIYIYLFIILYIYILLYPDDTQFVTIRIHLVRWCSHRNLHLWAISISHCHIWLPESVYLHWEGWNYRSSQATRGSPGRWLPAANKSGQLSSLIFHGEKW